MDEEKLKLYDEFERDMIDWVQWKRHMVGSGLIFVNTIDKFLDKVNEYNNKNGKRKPLK